jgi:hypothetical protein
MKYRTSDVARILKEDVFSKIPDFHGQFQNLFLSSGFSQVFLKGGSFAYPDPLRNPLSLSLSQLQMDKTFVGIKITSIWPTFPCILYMQSLPQRSSDSAVTGPVEIGPIPICEPLLRLEAVNLASIVTYLHNTLGDFKVGVNTGA